MGVIPFLERCGYAREHIVDDYRVPGSSTPGVIAFAHAPHDARTTCIAVAPVGANAAETATAWRFAGAPVVLLIADTTVEWWQPRTNRVVARDTIAVADLGGFFDKRRRDFGPDALYRAKTCGRLKLEYQLEFVDQGLLPFVEAEMGGKLSQLLENVLAEGDQLAGEVSGEAAKTARFHWMFESAFQLLAGRILRDKQVRGFRHVDFCSPEGAITQVRKHYGQGERARAGERWQQEFLGHTGQRVARLSSLANLTTETLALVYENTLVSKETRQRLGTHSTPGYLIDYVVWSLADWIQVLPLERRHVYEPCCGHAGFLIAAMRLLRDIGPGFATPEDAHRYLKQRLHGFETDEFAIEIARLGLTLADVPNPNGWDLRLGDIFISEWPEVSDPPPDIILMNPPFEDFKPEERQRYAGSKSPVRYLNRTAEVVGRTLSKLSQGGVFGLIVPQGFLHEKNSRPLRRMLCEEFELQEITLLPDGVFSVSEAESAILLGRRCPPSASTVIRIGWVDEKEGLERFRECEALSDVQRCPQQRLASSPDTDFRVPRLDDVWTHLAGFAKLSVLGEMGNGFDFVRTGALAPGATKASVSPFPGAARAFVRSSPKTPLHGQPQERWVLLSRAMIAVPRSGTRTGMRQIVVNYPRASRGPWRIKALLDPDGHAVSSSFWVMRPAGESCPLEFLWALLNSPVGNAFACCHLGKRHNIVGTLRGMPVPKTRPEDIARVTAAACRYLALARQSTDTPPLAVQGELCSLLLQVDAEILRLYDLPPRMERRLLELFQGVPRQGVPFTFTEYFAADFTPCIPLHEYLSPEYRRSTAGELRKRLRPTDDPDIRKALRAAVDAFTLDEEA